MASSSAEQLATSAPEQKILYRHAVISKGNSYLSLLWRWWSSNLGRSRDSLRCEAEEKLLKISLNLTLNNNSKDGKYSATIYAEQRENLQQGVLEFVPIHDGKNWINTLRLGVVHDAFDFYEKDDGKRNLVIAHGFGAGLGFFYRNYPQLARLKNYNVFAIDWLGMGNSSRPAFPKKGSDEEANIKQADEFFTSSLEEWRQRMRIEKMTLVGHSLGGYLSVKYALQFPERVEKLILVSPVGIPKHEPVPAEKLDPDFKPSAFFQFAQRLWAWEISPQSIIRTLGPLGQIFTNRYASRRFELGAPSQEEKSALSEYIYQISTGNGSGEYSAPRLLYPFFTGIKEIGPNGEIVKSRTGGIYARSPLSDTLSTLTMPATFIYGSTDWMNHLHAVRVAPTLKVPTKVAVVDKAGHHLYLDAPDAFNHALIAELEDEISSKVERDDVTYPFSSY